MKTQTAIVVLGLSLSALPAAVFAADAYVTGNVNLRSGPDSSYPTVARLRRGTTVALDGCVDGWAWCDVSTGEDRGWVSGAFLQQEYEGERLGIRGYGARIGIPIVSFEFGSYWNDHYRDRAWYGRREHWSHIRPRYRAMEERRGSHERAHEDWHERDHNRSHEHEHEDSHNYSHGDTHGNAASWNGAARSDQRQDAASYPADAANNRQAADAAREHRAHDDARAAARNSDPSRQMHTRADEPAQRNSVVTAPAPASSPNERNTAPRGQRTVQAAQVNPAPVATAAARPAVQVHSVTPAQNKAAAAVAAETAAKTREQERDDKDRR